MRNLKMTVARPSIVGKRLGKLTITGYAGRDQDTGQDVFVCQCHCGKSHQLDMRQIQDQTGMSWSCSGCTPAVKREDQNSRNALYAERAAEERAAAARLAEQRAEQQRQALAAHRKKVEEFFGETFEETMGIAPRGTN
jgi:hypothetical protein